MANVAMSPPRIRKRTPARWPRRPEQSPLRSIRCDQGARSTRRATSQARHASASPRSTRQLPPARHPPLPLRALLVSPPLGREARRPSARRSPARLHLEAAWCRVRSAAPASPSPSGQAALESTSSPAIGLPRAIETPGERWRSLEPAIVRSAEWPSRAIRARWGRSSGYPQR